MGSRRLGMGLVLMSTLGLAATGCGSTALPVLATSPERPMNVAAVDPGQSVLVRSQKPELDHPAAPAAQELPKPPVLPRPPAVPLPTPANTSGAAPLADVRNRMTVRALVNGKPIFDSEVMSNVGRRVGEIENIPQSQHAAAFTRIFDEELKQIIERELTYQDAMRKLSMNKQFLDKVKAAAVKEFDKKMAKRARELKLTLEQFKRMVNNQLGKGGWETLRRQEERSYIVFEYVRSRVFLEVSRVGREVIYEYYKDHLSEFCTVDRVQWQDIFITVGPNHPTMADARRFAEQILQVVRQGQPFEEFLRFDEGDSWSYRKGEGNGQLHGEIRPAELEPYLWKMKAGEVGPIVELSTGIHVFRVLKRDYAGQLPFNEQVQTRIGTKLKNAIADREYKHIVKELRERAVIDIQPGNPLQPAGLKR
jgi:hypothetical protein